MSGVLSSVPTTIPGLGAGTPVPTIPSSSGSFSTGGSGLSISSNPTLGLATLASAAIELLAVAVVLGLVGVFVIVVVANRADPDPSGHRPQSVYLFAVSFVTILVSILGSVVVVSGLVELVGNHSGSTNSIARAMVIGGLITMVGLFLLLTHLQRGLALARAGDQVTNPSRRVGQSYVSAVAFLSVLVLLVVTVVAAYLVFALAGPGVFGSFGGRGPTLRYLIVVVYLGVIAGVVLRTHRDLLVPRLRLFGADAGLTPATGPSPLT
jgi:hypothetical protein